MLFFSDQEFSDVEFQSASLYLQMANNGIIYNAQNRCASNQSKCWNWDIEQMTSPGLKDRVKYAVLILNRPIALNQDYIQTFWNDATVRITVDGGTVQWDKYIGKLPPKVQQTFKLPTLITGDFDSINAEVFEKYKLKDCKVVHTPDQNYTDFTKALVELSTYCEEKEIEMDYVIALGQCSGRLDHILGNLQTLYLNKEDQLLHPTTKLYIMSDDSLSWLLCPGDHVITIPEDTRIHKRSWCSLIPLGEACENVTSSGLKWNLDNQPLKFGDLISTSNTFSGSEKVTIKCSHTILWSMRIPSLAYHK